MAEVYAKEPHPSYEERVWRCLDYVFELPPAMSIIDKAKYIISGIRDRTLVYQSIRRMRAPTDMDQPMGPRPHTTAINHAARFWYPMMAKSQRARTGSPNASDHSASAATTPAMQTAYAQMGNQGMSTQASSASSSVHVSPNLQHAPHPRVDATTPPSRYDMGGADDPSRHQGYSQQQAAPPNPMAAPTPYGMPNMFNMSPGDTGSMGSGGVGGSPGDEAMLEIDWVCDLSFPPFRTLESRAEYVFHELPANFKLSRRTNGTNFSRNNSSGTATLPICTFRILPIRQSATTQGIPCQRDPCKLILWAAYPGAMWAREDHGHSDGFHVSQLPFYTQFC